MPGAPPTVTGLREQPRGRVSVELDGAPWRLVPADAVVRAGLSVGRALDREAARALGRELRRAEALARAARVLKHGDRSRRTLADRLARAGVAADAAESALETLERVGAVDDRRLGLNRAARLAERGFGDAAIRHDLEQQGLAGEHVEAALAALEPECERARGLVERRGSGPKTARWLAAKGFEAETVSEATGEFAAEP